MCSKGDNMTAKAGPIGEERVISTVCNSHCGGACILKVHVREGVITRIETDDGDQPQFRACLRGRAYRQRVYHPERLLYPMKRVGVRGEGKFERITWDEALETVAGELIRVRDTYGPASIMYFCSAGDIHVLHHQPVIHRLLCMLGGYTEPWGFISYEGAQFASFATYGTVVGTNHTRDDLLNSRLIVMWGWDPVNTIQSTNTTWYLAQAREAGIPIVAVDPRYTDSAATFARRWIPIKPGTDAAMLIAMAFVMVKEKLHDQKFLDTYTIGFDRFKDCLLGKEDGVAKTPAWAEAITGASASAIESLAREYATMRPAALISGISPGRSAYGEQYHRAAPTLAAMTGNIGVHGGSAADKSWGGEFWGGEIPFMVRSGGRMRSPGNRVGKGAPLRPNTLAARGAGTNSSARVNSGRFAEAILKGKAGGYPSDYKLLYLANTNYLNQVLNVNKTVEAFMKLEFLVVQEQFLTPTAKFADILLPVCTFLERNDFTCGGATPYYGLVNKVIEPLGESKSHLEIGIALAEKLGLTDYNDKTEEEWLKGIVAGFQEVANVPDYVSLKKQGAYKVRMDEPYVAFKKQIEDPANNPFPTPSGKIEIYSQELADMNNPEIPPIPKYIETWESHNAPLVRKYSLQLITTHLKRRAHSQFANLPWLMELQTQAMQISSVDAQARGISTGDMVKVFNDRGELRILAKVTERIMPGVVDIPQGAWYDPDENGVDRGGCANVLTRDAISPGGAFCSNTALVQVEKI